MNRKDKALITAFRETLQLKGLQPRTIHDKIQVMLTFGLSLKDRSFISATEDDINIFVKRREHQFSAIYMNMQIRTLKGFYSFLLDEGKILIDPTKKLKRIKRSNSDHLGVFTEREVQQIFSVIPETKVGIRNRAIFELLYSCGLRANELIHLAIGDIDFRERECTVRFGKGGTERIVPIGEKALNSLEYYLQGRKTVSADEPLFLSKYGNRVDDTVLRRSWHLLKHRAGVTTKGSLHALRHSCATHMLQRGAPLPMIQRLLGHAFLDSTELYTHLSEANLREVYRKAHPTAIGGMI